MKDESIVPKKRGTHGGKKILFLIYSITGGGAERVTVNLANWFAANNDVTLAYYDERKNPYPTDSRVKLVCLRKPDTSDEPAKAVGAAADFVRAHGKNPIAVFIYKVCHKISYIYESFLPPIRVRLTKQLKKTLKPDITVSMLELPNQINAAVRGGFRIMSERNDPSAKPLGYFEKSVESLKKADLVIFQTYAVQSMYPESIRKKSVVIRNPVSVEAVPFRCDSRKIVNVGKLFPQKNQAVLLRAFAEFSVSHPDYTLHIYGQGPLREELEQLIESLGLSGKAFLEGFAPDVHARIADARMFVMSSDYEGLPNALMEAMMMGLPVITTDCNGSSELVADGETGLVVPVGDAGKMAEAMAKMADDEELSLRVIENARAYAEGFRTEKIMGEWEEAFFSKK